jgi:hypothetical protein
MVNRHRTERRSVAGAEMARTLGEQWEGSWAREVVGVPRTGTPNRPVDCTRTRKTGKDRLLACERIARNLVISTQIIGL